MLSYVADVRKSVGRMRRRPAALRNLSGSWTRADDLRIFWFIQTYRDLFRLRRTLTRLRQVYPDSDVLVVSDGDPDPAIQQVCESHSVGFTLGSRLFSAEHGGKVSQRMLEAFLTTDADILIKIDPDTEVRRRFSLMPPPTDACLYGTVQSVGTEADGLTSIQGGCIIIPRQAATLLANSTLLESERLKPPALEWAFHEMSKARAARGLTSYDWTLGWACQQLGLPCRDHPEVYSRYLPNLTDTLIERWVAVYHPRFEIRHFSNYLPDRLRLAVVNAIKKTSR